MQSSIDRLTTAIQNSQMLRLLSVGFLALMLQIPIAMIDGLVEERQSRRQSAVEEVSAKWGGTQAIVGPTLVVPYTQRWVDTSGDQTITRAESRSAVFLPEELSIAGTLDADRRTRGIFTIPVFGLDLTVEGSFVRPSFAELGIEPDEIHWERAQLSVGISDVRAIQHETEVAWGDAQAVFLPGTGAFSDADTGIHAVVGFPDGAQRVHFAFPLALNGSIGLFLTPFARTTRVELQADSGNPSFQGNWLPADRQVSESAFRATWLIPFLGRNFPQAWRAGTPMREQIEGSRFGVELVDPVDHYRMAERSVKYAGLFILLTFAAVWLIEVLAHVRVHPIQYMLLGGALCLFYLLELSLSEHVGFPVAYALASVAVVGMVGAYSRVVLGRLVRALVVTAGVALLYGYLFTLLTNEDYALLIGSIGLFLILGCIMYATRRVDWYSVGAPAAPTDRQVQGA